jgi:hypothetical protein
MSRRTGYLILHVRLQDVKDLVCRCVVFSSQDEPREDINEMVGRGGKGGGEMGQIVEESISTGLGRGWMEWDGGKGTDGGEGKGKGG